MPSPESPWRKSGFQVWPGFSATAWVGGEGEAVRLADDEGIERVARVRARLAGIDGPSPRAGGRTAAGVGSGVGAKAGSASSPRRRSASARRRPRGRTPRRRRGSCPPRSRGGTGRGPRSGGGPLERDGRSGANQRSYRSRAQSRSQKRVDPRPEVVHRRDHLGARARIHVAAPVVHATKRESPFRRPGFRTAAPSMLGGRVCGRPRAAWRRKLAKVRRGDQGHRSSLAKPRAFRGAAGRRIARGAGDRGQASGNLDISPLIGEVAAP